VHEFIADAETAGLENDNDTYTDFLISNAYGITQNSLTNSFFNKNLLKRRITMLYQKKSGKGARLKYLLALPLTAGLLCASTMAFTAKTYGLVDLAPAKTNIKEPIKLVQPTFAKATENDNRVEILPATIIDKTPIVVGDGDIIHTKAPAGFKYNDLSTANYAHLLKINAKLVHSVKMLAPDAAKAKYGAKSANGIVLVEFTFPPPIVRPDPVVTAADVQPEFIGGMDALAKFLQKYVRYPSADKQAHTQGNVYVQFTVEGNGSVDHVKVLNSPSEAMGNEAARVMQMSPTWKPGTNKGKPVATTLTIPINFAISGDAPTAPFSISIPPPPPPVAPPQQGKTVSGTPNKNEVFTAVEVQPDFPGGGQALANFLQKNIHYPQNDKAKGVQGKVYIQFDVSGTGTLYNLKVLRSPSPAMAAEALRVMKLSPKWHPGLQNGKKVNVEFTLPINFALPPPPPPMAPGAPVQGGKPADGPNQIIPVKDIGKTVKNTPDNNAVYTAVARTPDFPGGEEAEAAFLRKNIKYPTKDKLNKIQGKVYIQFVVEKDGTLTDMKVLRTPSDAMAEEAIRVLKLSPKWIPGLQDGLLARVMFTQPINFALADK